MCQGGLCTTGLLERVCLHRDLHVAWNLLAAAIAEIHPTRIQRTNAMLRVARAPVNLEEQLPVGV